MGTPYSVIRPLQKIQNFAARLVLLAPHHQLSTPLPEKLHWLLISEHINLLSLKSPVCVSELYIFLTLFTSLNRPVHYALLLTAACRKSNNTNARLMASAPLALDPTFGIHSHKTLDTAHPCHLLKLN